MSTPEPERKPIFAFLWPLAPRTASVPLQHQARLVRIGGRGALRIIALALLFMTIVIGTGSVMLAGLSAGWSVWAIPASAALATACIVLFRGSVSGTYVNDDGIAVRTLMHSGFWPWNQSRVYAERGTVVIVRDGAVQPTHVRRWSVDWPLGGDRYDMAVQAMRSWATAHQAWGPEPSPLP